MLSPCGHCKQLLPAQCFSRDGMRRKRCKTCVRITVREDRCGTEAKRLLSRVRAHCRLLRWPEGSTWTLADVEALLKRANLPEDEDRWPRLRVVRLSKTKPFTPDNAKVIPYGMGL